MKSIVDHVIRIAACAGFAATGFSVLAAPEIVAPDLWRIAGDFGSVEGSVVCETNGFSVESHGCRVETRTMDSAQGVTARQTVVRNVGATSVTLTDLQDRWTFEGDDWEVYTQSNDWQLESIGSWEPVEGVVEHRAGGMRACDGATPMMAVWNRRTNEGHVFHAVSDGMWFFRAERLPAGLRVEAGYDPRHLRWTLAPGEQVALPEILTYETANRLDFDCHKLHAYWNARHPAREKKLSAIYNTWLCRFDKLDLDFLLKQVARAKEIGFDYFVVDAGWFGPKASWGSVRGDWEERPDGWLGGRLGEVSKAVREAGMKFGFWVEPECASAGARVVKEHPDWFFKAGGYFLDFRKPEAFDGLLETVCALVKRYEASFLKFDFNQTAAKDESGRDWADYNAAYRRFVEQVRARNPGIRIEGCASGGYMMDLSWSRTFDGFWLSDDQSLYDGVRIAKDTMLRLPPRCIERWLTLTRAHGIQPDYDGHDSRLLTTEDATWTNVRSVPLSRVEGFVAGGPFCMSCDLTTFDRNDVAHFREVIAKTRADSAFWQRAVGRILVDTPEATVLQYSDEKLFDVRLFAISHGTRAQRLTVRPALDAQAAYRVNGREHAATALAESGLAVTAPACGGACEVRLRKVHPQGAVRRPGGFHAPALRKHLGIPSVAVSPVNGRLWCVYYCGKTPGEDLNSYVVLSTSGDGGRTWKEVLVADTDEDGPFRTFDSELWVAPDGKLRWTWTERLCRLYEGDPSAPYGLDEGDSATDRLMMATLSAEEEPDEPPQAVQIGAGVMMCKPFVLADGAWMLPVAHWREAPSTCFYASTDGGKDFSRRGGVTIPEKMRLYDEPCAVQLRTGEILTFIRTGGEASHPLEALSSDGGKTWTEPRPARFAHTSSRVFLRRLASGNLLLVKNGPLDRDVGRRELTAFLSRDDGKTWEGGLVLDARANVSYPDGDQRADGTIVVVHDRDRLGAMEVLLSEFAEADVLAKKDVTGACRLQRRISGR